MDQDNLLALPTLAVNQLHQTKSEYRFDCYLNTKSANCPRCGQPSTFVHSYYHRIIQDLPIACHTVWLIVKTQRFKCQNTECSNHTFVGKLAFADSHAKRTNRLNDLIERTIVQSSSVMTSKLLETQGIQIKKSAICNLLKKRP